MGIDWSIDRGRGGRDYSRGDFCRTSPVYLGNGGDIMKWKIRGGKEIEIAEMETDHIENCIKMLNEQISEAETALDYVDEIKVGSFAFFEAENFIKVAEKYLKAFKKELKKR